MYGVRLPPIDGWLGIVDEVNTRLIVRFRSLPVSIAILAVLYDCSSLLLLDIWSTRDGYQIWSIAHSNDRQSCPLLAVDQFRWAWRRFLLNAYSTTWCASSTKEGRTIQLFSIDMQYMEVLGDRMLIGPIWMDPIDHRKTKLLCIHFQPRHDMVASSHRRSSIGQIRNCEQKTLTSIDIVLVILLLYEINVFAWFPMNAHYLSS